jgi:uncharacterized protein YkwD
MPIAIRIFTKAGAALVALAVLAGIATVPFASRAEAATYKPSLSSFDSRLLYDINHARMARGLRPLTVVAGTTDVAHGWACHMAAAAALGHNLRLGTALINHGSSLWTTAGENVGVVSSVSGADTLFRAYMNSPEHRANILDRTYRYVGIWSKAAAGRRWNTIDFVGSALSSYSYSYGPTRRTC